MWTDRLENKLICSFVKGTPENHSQGDSGHKGVLGKAFTGGVWLCLSKWVDTCWVTRAWAIPFGEQGQWGQTWGSGAQAQSWILAEVNCLFPPEPEVWTWSWKNFQVRGRFLCRPQSHLYPPRPSDLSRRRWLLGLKRSLSGEELLMTPIRASV